MTGRFTDVAPGCRYCFEANALLAAALAGLGFELYTVAGRWAWLIMLPCTVRQHAHHHEMYNSSLIWPKAQCPSLGQGAKRHTSQLLGTQLQPVPLQGEPKHG